MNKSNLKEQLEKAFSSVKKTEGTLERALLSLEKRRYSQGLNPMPLDPVEQKSFSISSIPPQGIIINQPGKYTFSQDLHWNPGNTGNLVAISVNCSDVTIQMNGYSLYAHPPGNMAGIVGIQIGHDFEVLENVNIQNGHIHNCSYHGISASLCHKLSIAEVHVTGSEFCYFGSDDLLTASGIFVDASSDISLSYCSVSGVNVTVPAFAGIQLFACIEGIVHHCHCSHLCNLDGTVTGFSYVAECQNILTLECHSEHFRSHYQANPMGKTKTVGHTVLGFLPTLCSNLEYKECTASHMRGCCDDCHGMSIFDSSNIEVSGFRAKGIVDGDCSRNTGAKATGLEVYGNNINIKNSVVESIFAIVPQDKQACGFSAAGENISFTNCVAYNVWVFDEFRMITTDNPSKYGWGIGFGWAPDPRPEFVDMYAKNSIYQNCEAVFCQVGFDSWNHQLGKWLDCGAKDCLEKLLNENSGATRIYSMDQCSELPPGMISPMTITNQATLNEFKPPIN